MTVGNGSGIHKDVLVWSAADLTAEPTVVGSTFQVIGSPDLMSFKDDEADGLPSDFVPGDSLTVDPNQTLFGTLDGTDFTGYHGTGDVFEFETAFQVTDGVNTFNIYRIDNNHDIGDTGGTIAYVSEVVLDPNATYTVTAIDTSVNSADGGYETTPTWADLAGQVDGSSGDDVIDAAFVDDDTDAVGGTDGANDFILGEGGGDTISAGAGNDLVYGDFVNDTPLGTTEYILQGFVRDLNFELESGSLRTDTSDVSISGTPIEIRIIDNDGGIGDDDIVNDVATDTDQLVEINGVLYNFSPDFTQVFAGSDGNNYTMMVVDVDRDFGGSFDNWTPTTDAGDLDFEHGQILIPIGTPPGPGVWLTAIGASTTVSNPDYTSLGGVPITNYNDSIDAGDGDDTVFGGQGGDTVLGGLGADTIYGDDGTSVSTGGFGGSTVGQPLLASTANQVNTVVTGFQSPPLTQVLDNGQVAYVWIDNATLGDNLDMTPQMRIANADGTWATDQVELSSLWAMDGFDGYDWDNMDIDLLPDGNLVISYVRSTAEIDNDEPVFSIIDPSALGTPAQYVVTNQEIQSSDTTTFESPPMTTVLDNGKILFIWTKDGNSDDNAAMNLHGRVYDPTTQTWDSVEYPISDIAIDGTDSADVDNLSVVQLTGGKIVVSWARSNIETGGTEPVYQMLDSSGAPDGVTREIQQVDDTTWESPAQIVALDDGNWMAVWIDNGYSDDTATMTLDARIFDASGTAITNDIQISVDAVDGFDGYDVENFNATLLGNGNVVVGYVENSVTGGSDNSPQFTILNSSGGIVAQDVEVAQNTTHIWPGAPVIEAIGDTGAFVVVYAEGNQASGGVTGLNYRVYDGDGNPLTNEMPLTSETDPSALSGSDAFDWSQIDVDYNPTNDTFVVSWVGQNDGDQTGVFTSGPISGVFSIGAEDANFGNDSLDGGDGADLIFGEGGDDTLDGGLGADSIDGGQGSDTIKLSDGFDADTIVGGEDGSGTDRDRLDASAMSASGVAIVLATTESGTVAQTTGGGTANFSEIEEYQLTEQNDTFDASALSLGVSAEGGGGADTLIGGSGADTLFGGAGDDSILGGGGNDFLVTGGGQDTLVGGDGDDTLTNADGDDSLVGGSGNDSIVASLGNDTLEGGAGNDTLIGGQDNDSILGGADDDLIYGDAFGLSLNDTGTDGAASVSTFNDMPTNQVSYEITFSSTTPGTDSTPLLSYAVAGSPDEMLLEVRGTNLEFTANNAGPTVSIDISGFNLFDGNVYSVGFTWDSATGATEFFIDGVSVGTGTAATGPLTPGGTFLLGQDQDTEGGLFDPNQIFQGEIYQAALWSDIRTSTEFANDAETLGADGSDPNLVANWMPDPQTGAMTDTQNGNNMTLSGDASVVDVYTGNDIIDGGDGTDTIYAGAGDDSIDGGTGNDTIVAGTGSDTIFLGNGYGGDSIVGGEDPGNGDVDKIDAQNVTNDGVDVFLSGNESGSVTSTEGTANFVEIERFVLSEQADSFQGQNSNNGVEVDGGGGADTLVGGSGNDTIAGGTGNDTITGGTGNDVLTGGDGDDIFVYNAGDGNDTIVDFNTGNTGTLSDGNSLNNDSIDLTAFYDNIWELHDDYADDGALNQSNTGNTVRGETVNYADNTSFGGGSLVFNGASADNTSFTSENTGLVCFVAGTFISTARGNVPVEELKPGDLVHTMDSGLQPVRWVGFQGVSTAEFAQKTKLRPVRISRSLFGLPDMESDLIVSPQHRILIRSEVALRMFGSIEVLIPAKKLLAMPGVSVVEDSQAITYHHILLDSHQILFANGAPAESMYLGQRAMSMLQQESRDELQAWFPALADENLRFPSCRPLVPTKKARNLADRLTKNNKMLLSQEFGKIKVA